MKKHIYSVLIMLLSCYIGYSQTAKPFVLKGELPISSPGYIFLYYPTAKDIWKKDSSLLDSGNFIFRGILLQPTVARLSYAKSMTEIILEPATMKAVVKNADNLTTLKMTGSKSQNELSELNQALQKVQVRWKTVIDTLTAVNKRSNASFQELKGWVLEPYFKEMEELNYNFINKYPTSVASAHVLQVFARELSTDTLERFYNRFPESVKHSRYGINIEQQLKKRKIGIPGTLATNFTKEDINGKKLSLSALQDKYVLLDFWGSWCVPCRKGNPHLIELYQKYKTKGFEILGIAADDNTPDAWRKAVIDDKLPWLHVLKGDTPATNVSNMYNIISYPTKILIDKTGTIIGRFGEEHKALDRMLEKIFTSLPPPFSQ